MTSTATPVDNGVNVEFLLQAREIFTGQPEAANFKWRVSNTWVNGTHSRSTVEDFFGLGEEQSHRTKFTFDGDHPPAPDIAAVEKLIEDGALARVG